MDDMKRSFRIMFMAVFMLAISPAAIAEIRVFNWTVDYLNWAPDCVSATIIAINGNFPGPTIRARAGDTIVVNLTNRMPSENVVIHWHGIRQFGTPWNDGAALVSQCAIVAGETYVYKFIVDKAGTFFYHGHYGIQRFAGLYGSLIVDMKAGEKEPFAYDGDISVLLSDWWHRSIYDQAAGIASIDNFVFTGEPQSILIEGRGNYNCSLIPPGLPGTGDTRTCNSTNPQCSPHVLRVQPGKTYRLRIINAANWVYLNFLIEGHNMTVVEADGNYVKPLPLQSLDIISGQSYSVLIKADQDPSKNYWVAVNVKSVLPVPDPTGFAVLHYGSDSLPVPLPNSPPPPSPIFNQTELENAAKEFVALEGVETPPTKSDRMLILLTTVSSIVPVDGIPPRIAINNVSLEFPQTPFLAAIKYNISGAYDTTPPLDIYEPRDYNISQFPPSPKTIISNRVYTFEFNSTVDVILQNAVSVPPNISENHPWHLHGHDFWVLGYGKGVFDPAKDPQTYNLKNPPLRNSVAMFSFGWTAIRFKANNPGVWLFHCHLEPHMFGGMAAIFAEGVDRVKQLPKSTLGCGLTKNFIHLR